MTQRFWSGNSWQAPPGARLRLIKVDRKPSVLGQIKAMTGRELGAVAVVELDRSTARCRVGTWREALDGTRPSA